MSVVTLPILLTEDQVAARLDVHRETIARERRRGKFPFHRVGRSIRFTEADIEEYLEGVRCATTSSHEAQSGTSVGPTREREAA